MNAGERAAWGGRSGRQAGRRRHRRYRSGGGRLDDRAGSSHATVPGHTPMVHWCRGTQKGWPKWGVAFGLPYGGRGRGRGRGLAPSWSGRRARAGGEPRSHGAPPAFSCCATPVARAPGQGVGRLPPVEYLISGRPSASGTRVLQIRWAVSWPPDRVNRSGATWLRPATEMPAAEGPRDF